MQDDRTSGPIGWKRDKHYASLTRAVRTARTFYPALLRINLRRYGVIELQVVWQQAGMQHLSQPYVRLLDIMSKAGFS